jgi:hypothetical protein
MKYNPGKFLGVSVILASLVAGGLGLAEGPAPQASPASPDAGVPEGQGDGDKDHDRPPNVATPAAEGDLTVPLRSRAEISVAEMNQQVQVYFDKMDDTLRRMVQLQDVARKEKDVIKLNCVNDRLQQLKQLMNIADQARTNMLEAIARGDEEARYHEFGRITIAQQQAQALATESENCIGEDLSFIGPTRVSVEEPVMPDDPTAEIGPDFPIVEPLPVASPQE